MKKNVLLICISVFIVPISMSHAEPCSDIGQYSCYQERVGEFCTNSSLPWNNEAPSDLGAVGIGKYEAIDATKINNTISNLEQADTNPVGGLTYGVSMDALGASGDFRIVEVAAKTYKGNMNRIFACAVLSSRSAKLTSLMSATKSETSELKQKIKKELSKYDRIRGEMQCNQSQESDKADGTIEKTMKSTMIEYCKYSYYLDYIGENVRNNISKISEVEGKIGNNNGTKRTTTTDGALGLLTERGSAIDRERTRAHNVLPKAIMTLEEMDRTYIIHVMLTVIYDDYVSLRDQLAVYLRLVGQTFEKAKGAQDSRNR